MQFRICYDHLDHPHSVDDFFLLLHSLILAAGYAVTVDRMQFSPNCCCIILECFNEKSEEQLLNLKRQGGEFIIVGTEYITGETFNHFGHLEKENRYGDFLDYWKTRYKYFLRCARHARAVWLTTQHGEVVSAYQKVLGDVPVHFIPPCFFPESFPNHRGERDLEIFFSGTSTDHRRYILDQLIQRSRLIECSVKTPSYLRQEFSRRSKLCLNLRIHDKWPYPSQLRTWYHLMNGNLVVQEACPETVELEAYTVKLDRDQIVEGCIELLRSGQWVSLTNEAIERFANDWHANKHARAFIERTFQ